YVDDTVDTGVKAEIYGANGQVVAALETLAEREAKAGNWNQSVSDSLLAAKTAGCVRGFDLTSMARENQYLLRSLRTVKNDLPHLSANGKQAVARALPLLHLADDQVADLAVLERNLYVLHTMDRDTREAERFTKEITTQDLSDLGVLGKRGRLRKLAAQSG